MKSTVKFDRWKHVQCHTWPFQMYKQYDLELSNYFWSEYAAHLYVEGHLRHGGYVPTDDSRTVFSFPSDTFNVPTMGEWENAYSEALNFLYLNCVMAMSSNLETFLSAIISLAIESNPGVLLDAPKSIDGVKLLKYHPLSPDTYKKQLKDCVDGTWTDRKNAIKKLFGSYPSSIDTHFYTLERIRLLRNRVGHAFGRDINAARDFSSLTRQPMERVTLRMLRNWLGICYEVAEEMDAFLLDNSIGEYQIILAYHKNKATLDRLLHAEKIRTLKKMYGRIDQQVGLEFCRGLVDYYDNL